MKVNKSKTLYGNTSYNGKTPASSNTKIGKTMPLGIGMSKYASGNAVKISTAALYLDSFLLDKMFYAYSNKTHKFLLLEMGKDLVVTDGKIARSTTNDNDTIVMADILWEMECNGNEEMASLFHHFCKSTIPLKEAEVAKFCDSYYSHNVRDNYQIEVSDLVEEEISASIRSGLLKKAGIISDLSDLPESRFANTHVVEKPSVKKRKGKEKDKDSFFSDCLAGKYRINHVWTDEQKPLIPDLSFLDNMVVNDTFRKFVNKIQFRTKKVIERCGDKNYADDSMERLNDLGRDAINVSFVGKPGTGKSFNVHAAAAACGLPVYVVNCSQNTDEDRFEGMTKIVEGKPMAIPTEAVKCFRDGGILLLEEVNLAQSAVIMGALGQAVEYPYILKQDGYHDIRRHPLCIVVSTMNVGTAGTKTVAQQFANRFKTSYVMDDPGEDEFIARLMKDTGEDRKLCTWIHDCYMRITESVREDNAQADVDGILNSLSVRSCIGAIENIQEGSSPKEAIYDSLIGKIAEQDAEVAANCRQLIGTMVDVVKRGA